MDRIEEDGFVLYLKEDVDFSSINKSMEEINKFVKYYDIKVDEKVSPEGQTYQQISGEYQNVVCFLGEIFDMSIVEVMSNICDKCWWDKPGRGV